MWMDSVEYDDGKKNKKKGERESLMRVGKERMLEWEKKNENCWKEF